MSPKSSTQTAAGWRRTKHLRETLDLVRCLDGTRTVAEACIEAGIENHQTGWRIVAVLRHLASEEPHLVAHTERREGRRVFHRVELLPGGEC
jgi:hypothetical protein